MSTPGFNPIDFQEEAQSSSMGLGGLDFEKLLSILNKSLWWIILFIVLSLSGAYLYLRYTKPIFESQSIIKLDVQKKNDISGLWGKEEFANTNLSGEIELIKSKSIHEQVIDKMSLDVTYLQIGNFLNTEMYKVSPFEVEFEIKNPAFYNVPIGLEIINDKEFIL